MAQFQIDIQKHCGGEFWTNRYFVTAADINTAHEAGNTIIAPAEQDIHCGIVVVDRIRTSTITPNDLVFRTNALALTGSLGSSGNGLPLFNCVRVDFGVSVGRPSRKFYRSGLGGGNVASGFNWDSSSIDAIDDTVTAMMASLSENSTPLVDPDGDTLFGHTMFATIAMRQLRRGTRRRTEPIL